MRTRTRSLAVLSAVVLTTAAAVTGGDYLYHHEYYTITGIHRVTLTQPQALAKTNGILTETINSVTPRLKWWNGWPLADSNMSRWTGAYDGTALVTGEAHIITNFSAAKQEILFDLLARNLKKEGYSIWLGGSDHPDPGPYKGSLGLDFSAKAADGTEVEVSATPDDLGPSPYTICDVIVQTGDIAWSPPDPNDQPWRTTGAQPAPPSGAWETKPSSGADTANADDPYWSH